MPNKRILIVDDDKNNRSLLEKSLRFPNCIVDTTCNGQEALELSIRNNYDIVITDFHMPDLNGDELAKQIKSHCPSTVIIGISGNLKHSEQFFLKAGINIYFEKPFKLPKFKTIIKKILFN